jgi:3-hydroxyisobutyrate dehydrogenase-like beta-hydroxyacid dehydrogenase
MKIGFIGLGAMGAGMARHLLDAGHEMTVWNRTPSAADALVAAGATLATSAAGAAGGDVLHSMLANDAAVREVLVDSGAIASMAKGTVHVNHATISVALATELVDLHRTHGMHYVAAPVFGRPDMAAAGKLNIVVAGASDAVAKVMPLLQVMAARVWPFGDAPVRANVAKIAGNFMLASAIESMAEATALTRAHGVAAADFLEVMTGTLFAAPAYQSYGALIASERYEPAGFKMSLGLKDVELARTAGKAKGVPLPFADVVGDSLREAITAGDGELDWSALAKVAARRAGLA